MEPVPITSLNVAYNLIGFNVDATGFLDLISETLIGYEFGSYGDRFDTSARISASTIAAGGLISVRANNSSFMNAVVSVKAKSEADSSVWHRKVEAAGFGFSLPISNSKINTSTTAKIDNASGSHSVASTNSGTIDTATGTGSVLVEATDSARIGSDAVVVAGSKTDNDFIPGASAISRQIGKFAPAKYRTDGGNLYHATFQTNGTTVTDNATNTAITGTTTVNLNDTVSLSEDYLSASTDDTGVSTGEAGSVYRYLGTTADLDLATQDYTDTKLWASTASRGDAETGFLKGLFGIEATSETVTLNFGDRVGTTSDYEATNGGQESEQDLPVHGCNPTNEPVHRGLHRRGLLARSSRNKPVTCRDQQEKSDSVGVGAIFVRNELEAVTEATIDNSDVDATGDVSVTATQASRAALWQRPGR